MEFTPITNKEADDAMKPAYLLKPGICDFDVRKAEEVLSKKSNRPMIKLTLDVWDADGKQAIVFDNLMSGIPFLDAHFRRFAFAVGLGHAYEAGKIDAEQCEGKGGQCLIRNKEQAGYDPKNEVADFLLSDKTKKTASYQNAKTRDTTAGAPKDDRRTAAWKKFCAKTTALNAEGRKSAWNEATKQYFAANVPKSGEDASWDVFGAALPRWDIVNGWPQAMRAKELVTSPISEEPQIDDADIPF